MDELRRTFRPEFLNRVDEIVVFHQLGRAASSTASSTCRSSGSASCCASASWTSS